MFVLKSTYKKLDAELVKAHNTIIKLLNHKHQLEKSAVKQRAKIRKIKEMLNGECNDR